jgi:hypothetical protein
LGWIAARTFVIGPTLGLRIAASALEERARTARLKRLEVLL